MKDLQQWILEARSPSCWSDRYVLKLDGRPAGEFRGRCFTENIDIRMTQHRRFHLQRNGWLGDTLTLTEGHHRAALCEARRSGMFTTSWNLDLSAGPSELVSAGLFNTGYRVLQGSLVVARVHQIGWCGGGWRVVGQSPLADTDLLFIGLVYHTIVRRNAAVAASTASS